MPPNAASCYTVETEEARAQWLGQMTGPAHDEAVLPIEQHIAFQQRLVGLGYMPQTTKVDGIYGEATRTAITA